MVHAGIISNKESRSRIIDDDCLVMYHQGEQNSEVDAILLNKRAQCIHLLEECVVGIGNSEQSLELQRSAHNGPYQRNKYKPTVIAADQT